MVNDFFCECGHRESKHDLDLYVCFGCYNENGEFECECQFKLDNLRYLEDLSRSVKVVEN